MSEVLQIDIGPATGSASIRSVLQPHRILIGAFLLLTWGILCRALSGEWSINEQYSYGWFVPFFALYLFWVRWESRPPPTPPPRHAAWLISVAIGLPAFFLLLPVRLFEVANPDWRLLGWIHAPIAAALTLLLLWRAGGNQWLRHFAFPIAFFFVAVPWLLRIETPVVQGLMKIVAALATDAITLFGIPAQVDGSLIHISNGVVGVNEACSGVRSLQTSLMIALLLGELKMLSVVRRVLLVGGAIAIALLANLGRSFFLVWTAATRGIATVEQWHDAAGYSIVLVVFVGALLIATLLGRHAAHSSPPTTSSTRARVPPFTHTSWIVGALCWITVVEVGVESWYRWHEARSVPQPRWTVQWPKDEPGFRKIAVDEQVKRTLRYDDGGEVSWRSPAPTTADTAASYFLFFFRWKAGVTSVLRARSHKPEYCLPNVGWHRQSDHGFRRYRVADSFSLAFRHFTFEQTRDPRAPSFADTFFCVYEDRIGAGIDELTGDAPIVESPERLARVVRVGLRNPGQQVMELVIVHPRPLPADEAEAQFAKIVRGLVTTDSKPQNSANMTMRSASP
jgi:exosortase